MKIWNNVTVISNFDELKQAVYKRFILGYDSKIMVCSSIHLNQTAAVFTFLTLFYTVGG
jgi:hypothetical protein